jgi:hypothetical protein
VNLNRPIQKIESRLEMRLEWNNREARHDPYLFWAILLFWTIWTPLTVWATSMIFRRDDALQVFGFCLWCIGGWFGTILIPYKLLQRYWSEWISVSGESILCGQEGLLAPKPKCIPVSAVSKVSIGRYNDPLDCESRESVVTLNVCYFTAKGREARQMVAYWLHPNLKERVFCEMQEFAIKHQIPLTFQRY